jgi:DNA-binding transcriptional regulator YdaS (Cro superfamily)
MDTGLQKAFEAAGSPGTLARMLRIDRAAVYRWKDVPAHWIIEIERITGVPREELRPDLYLAPRPKKRA